MSDFDEKLIPLERTILATITKAYADYVHEAEEKLNKFIEQSDPASSYFETGKAHLMKGVDKHQKVLQEYKNTAPLDPLPTDLNSPLIQLTSLITISHVYEDWFVQTLCDSDNIKDRGVFDSYRCIGRIYFLTSLQHIHECEKIEWSIKNLYTEYSIHLGSISAW